MLITEWIRAAVSGETIDERSIESAHIEQIAESYDPSVFTARIWMEHQRGVLPDNDLAPLGEVVAAKSETVTKGALQGQTALYVKLAPSPELVRLVRSGQKLHLSIEMHPQFPTTGGAYLSGLGVTDSPASLGTEAMKFNQNTQGQKMYSKPLPAFGNKTSQQEPDFTGNMPPDAKPKQFIDSSDESWNF